MSVKYKPLTKEEVKLLKTLKTLQKTWPKDIWLFANGVNLYVMKRHKGERVSTYRGGGVDPDYMVDALQIPSDGGDW